MRLAPAKTFTISEQQFRYIEAVTNLIYHTPRPNTYCSCGKEVPGQHNLGSVLVGIENGLVYWLAEVKQNNK